MPRPPPCTPIHRQLVLLGALALAISACAPMAPPRTLPTLDMTVEKPSERQLIGTWSMEAVFQDAIEVSDAHNPERNRWIELRADHSFASDGDPYGPNTGVWRFDPAAGTLEILSDLGTEDDSVWRVAIRGRQMVWRGVGSQQAERITIVSRRAR